MTGGLFGRQPGGMARRTFSHCLHRNSERPAKPRDQIWPGGARPRAQVNGKREQTKIRNEMKRHNKTKSFREQLSPASLLELANYNGARQPSGPDHLLARAPPLLLLVSLNRAAKARQALAWRRATRRQHHLPSVGEPRGLGAGAARTSPGP